MMPNWVTPQRAQSNEDLAYYAGAALATLHAALADPAVPLALLRARLSLRAAETCVALTGRPERASALRDEVHLLRPGDQPGPAGATFQYWLRVTGPALTPKMLCRALSQPNPSRITTWLSAGRGAPVECASKVLGAVLADAPRSEHLALILADAALARALGWGHVVPLLALHLKSRDLRCTGDELRAACLRAVTLAAMDTVQLAVDLSRRAARLEEVRPKLRAKTSDRAVDLFLTRDALSPSLALASFMSDRAARRLCDRLVDLGALREVTGRDTYRLYGL